MQCSLYLVQINIATSRPTDTVASGQTSKTLHSYRKISAKDYSWFLAITFFVETTFAIISILSFNWIFNPMKLFSISLVISVRVGRCTRWSMYEIGLLGIRLTSWPAFTESVCGCLWLKLNNNNSYTKIWDNVKSTSCTCTGLQWSNWA